MMSQTRSTLLSLAALPALLVSGCTAQEVVPKSAQSLASPTTTAHAVAASQTDLFIKNDNLKTVFFESGKSQLDPQSMAALKANVDWLKLNLPLKIEIAGYSDGRGTAEQNLAVGQRRAGALRDFYVSMGIPRSRISTVSLGQEEPVCFEQTEECQSQNRRVETLIENKSLASK